MPWLKPKCREANPNYRVDRVSHIAHRTVCSCGWESKYFEFEQQAVEAWGLHRGRRQVDAGTRLK